MEQGQPPFPRLHSLSRELRVEVCEPVQMRPGLPPTCWSAGTNQHFMAVQRLPLVISTNVWWALASL